MKFYFCRHCGNIITHFKDSGVRVVCCGEKMLELVPGTTDGATEKHVPVVKIEGNKVTVTVGSTEHPMVEAHFIEWIVLETRRGFQKKELKPGEKPEAEFLLPEGEAAVAAYEYCNLHGLWKAEI
jgi:superoxide reductase